MEQENIKKIEFDGENYLTREGISEMLVNPNNLDYVYNSLETRQLFLLDGATDVQLYEENIRQYASQMGFPENPLWRFLDRKTTLEENPRTKKILHSRVTLNTLILFGLFQLKKRDFLFTGHDKNYAYRLQANGTPSYVIDEKNNEASKLDNNFYCDIKKNNLNQKKDDDFSPSPLSAQKYKKNGIDSPCVFYSEKDVLKLLDERKINYTIIDSTHAVKENFLVELNEKNSDNVEKERIKPKKETDSHDYTNDSFKNNRLPTKSTELNNSNAHKKCNQMLLICYLLLDLNNIEIENLTKEEKKQVFSRLYITNEEKLKWLKYLVDSYNLGETYKLIGLGEKTVRKLYNELIEKKEKINIITLGFCPNESTLLNLIFGFSHTYSMLLKQSQKISISSSSTNDSSPKLDDNRNIDFLKEIIEQLNDRAKNEQLLNEEILKGIIKKAWEDKQ